MNCQHCRDHCLFTRVFGPSSQRGLFSEMPKAHKSAGVDKYPGLKEFATRVYRETPNAQHDSLRLQLNYFVNQAKLKGEATNLNWTTQTLQTLAARFGSPTSSHGQLAASPSSHRKAKNASESSQMHHSQVSNTKASVQSAQPHLLEGKIGSSVTGLPSSRSESYLQDVLQKKNEQQPRLAPKTAHRKPFKESNPLRASQSATKLAAVKNRGVKVVPSADFSASSSPLSHTHIETKVPKQEKQIPFLSSPAPSGGDDFSVSTSGAGTTWETKNTQKAPKIRQAQEEITERRRARFEAPSASESPYMELHTGGPIVGTNQRLEKSYFRLTGQVNASVVRPPDVIERALQYVYGKYKEDRSNYSYISDQFKSLRQDLTVQHIVSSLTVRVYECNARVAIEHDDLGEYNQCSAQLQSLYAHARQLRDREEAVQMLKNEKEFQAYIIYYKIYVGAWEELGALLRELDTDVTRAEPSQTSLPAPSLMLIRALRCVTIITTKQNFALCACWHSATPLEQKLIGKFAVRAQLLSLEAMARATTQQNQTLSLEFLGAGLGIHTLDGVRAFLDTWKVPHNGMYMRSVDALPLIGEAVKSVSGRADIKGQI